MNLSGPIAMDRTAAQTLYALDKVLAEMTHIPHPQALASSRDLWVELESMSPVPFILPDPDLGAGEPREVYLRRVEEHAGQVYDWLDGLRASPEYGP